MRRAPRFLPFLGLSVALVCLLFSDAFVYGRVLSQADILFLHAPWSAHAPAGFVRPGNDLLSDIPQVFYPFLSETAASLRAWRLPTWTTGIFGGHPFLASYQTATFSLFTLPALALPTADALLAGAMLKLLVGAIGMWLYLRRLGLSAPAVWFGSVAWLLNPFSVVWIEHPVSNVSAWLPFLLWSVDRLLASRSARDVGLLAVMVGVVILAGHPETSYKVLLFGGVYVLTGLAVQARGEGARPAIRGLLWRFAPAGLLGFVLAAIQLAPFAEYLTRSYVWEFRREAAANVFPAPLETLVTSIVPNFFGNPTKGLYLPMENSYGVISNFNEQLIYPGVAVWVLAAIGAFAAWGSWRVRFFVVSAAVAGFLMYGVPGFVHLLMLVPGASVIVLTRFGLVTIAAAMVLAAYGVDALTRSARVPDGVRTWPAVAVLALMAAGIGVFLVWARRFLAANGLLESTLVWCAAGLAVASLCAMAVVGRRRGRLGAPIFAGIVGAAIVVELFVLGWRFHPMIPRAQLFASTPELDLVRADRGLFRVAGIGFSLLPNTAMAYGLQDLRGYDGMQPSVHGEVAGISHKGGAFRVVKETDTFQVLDLMNVKYVFAAGDARLPAPHFTRLFEGRATVFRNEQAFPRVFLVDQIRVSTPEASLALIRSGEADLRREAVLYETLPEAERPEPAASGDEGVARVTRYESTFVEIETDASGRRVMVMSDLDYPGWRAEVDGAPARILLANRGLRAVALPAGRHRVVFRFEPMSVRAGAWVSILALASVAVLIASPRVFDERPRG